MHENQSRRDCSESVLTSSSPLLNPVIIPSPLGWPGILPATNSTNKKKDNNTWWHFNFARQRLFYVALKTTAAVCFCVFSFCGPTQRRQWEKIHQTNLCDLKTPQFKSIRDQTKQTHLSCLAHYTKKQDTNHLMLSVLLCWQFIVTVLTSMKSRQFSLHSSFPARTFLFCP